MNIEEAEKALATEKLWRIELEHFCSRQTAKREELEKRIELLSGENEELKKKCSQLDDLLSSREREVAGLKKDYQILVDEINREVSRRLSEAQSVKYTSALTEKARDIERLKQERDQAQELVQRLRMSEQSLAEQRDLLEEELEDLKAELEGKTVSSIAGWPAVTTVLSAFERGTLGSVRTGTTDFRLGVLYQWLLENLDIDDLNEAAEGTP